MAAQSSLSDITRLLVSFLQDYRSQFERLSAVLWSPLSGNTSHSVSVSTQEQVTQNTAAQLKGHLALVPNPGSANYQLRDCGHS